MRHDGLAAQGQVRSDANPGASRTGIEQGFEHLSIAVGRFDENLGSKSLPRIFLQFS